MQNRLISWYARATAEVRQSPVASLWLRTCLHAQVSNFNGSASWVVLGNKPQPDGTFLPELERKECRNNRKSDVTFFLSGFVLWPCLYSRQARKINPTMLPLTSIEGMYGRSEGSVYMAGVQLTDLLHPLAIMTGGDRGSSDSLYRGRCCRSACLIS